MMNGTMGPRLRALILLWSLILVLGMAHGQQGRVTQLSPNPVAQNFPWFEGSFPLQVFVSDDFAESGTDSPQLLRFYRPDFPGDPFVYEVSAEYLGAGQGWRVTAWVDAGITQVLGEVELEACRYDGQQNEVCTSRPDSARLTVMRPVVTALDPLRITAGVSAPQTVIVNYLLETYDDFYYYQPSEFRAFLHRQDEQAPPIEVTVIGPVNEEYDALNKAVEISLPESLRESPGVLKFGFDGCWD